MAFEFDLAGKVAIVTGASRGIGRAIAVALAEQGATIVATGRDQAALEATRERLGKAPRTTLVSADLRDAAAVTNLVETAVAEHGRIDIVVNSAGATKRGDFLDLPDEDVLDGFALKYHAAVRLCRAAWPHLKASSGSIVNISGIGAHTPSAEFTIGGPVNAALINFTKAIADRALEEGIRVNLVSPGHIVTDRLTGRIETLARSRGEDFEAARERMRVANGITRFGEVEDIANMVVFLCSPLASYVHGASIDVDGGATRGI